VLGAALEDKFGGHLTIGPAVQGGFYYDMFLGDQRLSEANFEEIEAAVSDLRKSDAPFERLVITRDEALELFAHNPFKVDLIKRKVAPDALTTAYRCGDLVDLPHLPSTSRVKAFKVTKNSSAYWLGSADNDSLQRIYGVSFPSEKLLKAHLRRLEEAKERDHRRARRPEKLFFFDAVMAQGSCFWTSYGARLYNRLQELMRAEYRARGFDEVITPNITASELFKRSGHYQNYRLAPGCFPAFIGVPLCSSLVLLRLHGEMVAEAMNSSTDAAVRSRARAAHWQAAAKLLVDACAANISCEVISFNSTISSCARAAQWQVALNLMLQMSGVVLLPTVVTQTAAIAACEGGTRWLFAMQLYATSEGFPDAVCCSAALGVCRRARRWQCAFEGR
ncbi:THS1, partial [Symbiodinium sp. KB8]